jgi:hypothetical protein
MLVLGILLATVAVLVVAALVIVATRPRRRTVVPYITPTHDASTESPDGSLIETTIVPAPTLGTDSARGRWDGGANDPCAALKRARDRDAGAALIDKLTMKCAAAGGDTP